MGNGKEGLSAILLVHCADRTGIVATITDFLYKNGGNILYLDQHVDAERGVFFMRVEWALDGFAVPREELTDTFGELIADKLSLEYKIHFSDERPRVAIFVSKLQHCLYDLLSSVRSGYWPMDIELIISNHPDLRGVAENFGIDFHHVPITSATKASGEAREVELLSKYNVDFIVLARYMQILSDDFVRHYPNRIINIHHSFLPAFPGAKPYHSAFERGVKVIGATSHYVTAELDAGPIIEQDVVRITHRDSVGELVRKGRELEKFVLTRAVWNHLKRKILVYANRTIVFD